MGGRDREDALSEIIGFVLILALIVVASTLYLMYVVPAEGREDEIEHMNQVKDRFVSYKTTLDHLWLRSVNTFEQGGRGVTLSTSFDLGTGGGNTQASGLFLSFMRPIGTAARMHLRESGDRFFLTLDEEAYDLSGYPTSLGADPWTLGYSTENNYWIQQVYSYECGGLFLDQPGEGVSVKIAPPFSVYNSTVNGNPPREIAKLSIGFLKVGQNGGKSQTLGGTGPLRIDTRLREDIDVQRSNPLDPGYSTVTFSVRARDSDRWADAWYQVFNDAVQANQIGPEWYSLTRKENEINLTLTNGNTPDVYLDLTSVNYKVSFEYADL